jgi:hypothetical protein
MNRNIRISVSFRILAVGVFFLAAEMDGQWTFQGLSGKLVTALATDPASPDTIWAGTAFNGAFRSMDSGATWTQIGPNSHSFASVSAIALRPGSASAFIGTPTGVFGWSEGDASWSSLFEGGVNTLAIDLTRSVLHAGGDFGESSSQDDGRSWRNELAGRIYALLEDRFHPSIFYGGADYDYIPGYYPGDPPEVSGGSVLVSRDNGGGWAKNVLDFGLPVKAFTQDPFSGAVYAATPERIFSSIDAGATWKPVAAEGLQTTLLTALVADPVRPGVLYAATGDGTGVFRSSDGGLHFQRIGAGLPAGQLLGSVRALTVDRSGETLWAGVSSGGVYVFDLTAPIPCEPDAQTLCLLDGRFRVTMSAEDPSSGDAVAGDAIAANGSAGAFSLPGLTGDPTLPEIVVKMVDASAPPWKRFWVFFGSLTSLDYAITVTDTINGHQERYTGSGACGGADTASFVADAPNDAGAAQSLVVSRPEAGTPGDLILLGGRFTVSLQARSPSTAGSAGGTPVLESPVSGFFSLPELTGSASLPEVWVKIVDARKLDGRFWFFYAGLTNLSYTLTVHDDVTGESRSYSGAGGGAPECGGFDTSWPGEEPPASERP